jgi:hypothetical protein
VRSCGCCWPASTRRTTRMRAGPCRALLDSNPTFQRA